MLVSHFSRQQFPRGEYFIAFALLHCVGFCDLRFLLRKLIRLIIIIATIIIINSMKDRAEVFCSAAGIMLSERHS